MAVIAPEVTNASGGPGTAAVVTANDSGGGVNDNIITTAPPTTMLSRESVLELASSTTSTTTTKAQVLDFDDGHVPENCKVSNNSSNTKLINYPEFFENRTPMVHVIDNAVPSSSSESSSSLVKELYNLTVLEGKPWGTYVTVEEILEYQKKGGNNDGTTSATTTTTKDSNNKNKDELAVAIASMFFQNALLVSSSLSSSEDDHQSGNGKEKEQDTNKSFPIQQQSKLNVRTYTKKTSSSTSSSSESSTTPESNNELVFWTRDDFLHKAHGVAIWALASDIGSSVAYHLDYAEQIRYEYNVIVPPLLAGTFQCTPCERLDGGDFVINLNGLKHYDTYGYKGIKTKERKLNYQSPLTKEPKSVDGTAASVGSSSSSASPPANNDDDNNITSNNNNNARRTAAADPSVPIQDGDDWITIPYRCNRMILASGHLPHMSTPIVDIVAPSKPLVEGEQGQQQQQSTTKLKRVIVGFNVFGYDYGSLVQAAPEHSDVFRRKVQLQRALQRTLNLTTNNNNNEKDKENSNSNKITLDVLTSNKGLSKLLVLAKREKIKLQLKQSQQKLDESLEKLLLLQQREKEGGDHHHGGLSVETLMKQLAASTSGLEDGNSFPTPTDVQVHINQRLKKDSELAASATTGNEENTTRQPQRLRLCLKRNNNKDSELSSSSTDQQRQRQRMVQPEDIVYLV